MFRQLEKDEFEILKKKSDRVLIYREFPADLITPMTALLALKRMGKKVTLLESAEMESHVGRFSFLGYDRVAEFRTEGLMTKVNGEERAGDPFELLRGCMQEFGAASDLELPGFVGGAVGYVGYDAVRYVENIPDRHAKSRDLPEIFFQFYQSGLAIDHGRNVAIVMTISDDYESGMDDVKQLYMEISKVVHPEKHAGSMGKVTMDLSDKEFSHLVKRAQEYIVAGDIFQVVPSRSFETEVKSDPMNIYRALRLVGSAPYMFYIENEDFTIVGASPEKLISVRGKEIETIPLAGTRPRGSGNEDLLLEKELIEDPKEDAEHMMLVDLGRNDLGAIAEHGSVQVERLKVVQRFSHVMHLASFVKGRLREGLDAIDALKAAFPAGTLSGAPKIRAMEIIDELEGSRRGAYGGAICMLSHGGNLESCIAIRMAVIKNGIARVRAGAGVVFDSDPQKEADETAHKAKVVLEAIRLSEEGLI